jgi:hypothetical protein
MLPIRKRQLSRRNAKKWAIRTGWSFAMEWQGPNGDGSFGFYSAEFMDRTFEGETLEWFIQPAHRRDVHRYMWRGWHAARDLLASLRWVEYAP